jgi:hypothetical protein
MTGDTPAALAVRFMKRMLGQILHDVIMTRLAGPISSVPCMPVSSAGCVTMQAIKVFRFITGAHPPKGKRIVFTEIPAIRVKVLVFQSMQAKVVEISITGFE